MAFREIEDIIVEDAKLHYRNFDGEKSQSNPKGALGLGLILDPAKKDFYYEEGWKIKVKEYDDPDRETRYYIPVTISFDNPKHMPRIGVLNVKRNVISEVKPEQLHLYQRNADIIRYDVIVTPYCWTMPDGSSGVKAYLKELIMHVQPTGFEYLEDVPGYRDF